MLALLALIGLSLLTYSDGEETRAGGSTDNPLAFQVLLFVSFMSVTCCTLIFAAHTPLA